LSTIKVNTIENRTGSSITIGGSSTTSLNLASTITGGTLTNTPAFLAYPSSAQTISANTITTGAYNTEVYDTDGDYDTSTYIFTPTKAGTFYIFGSCAWNDVDTGQDMYFNIYLNNSTHIFQARNKSNGNRQTQIGGVIVEMNGSTDNVRIRIEHSDTSGTIQMAEGRFRSMFGGYRLIGA